MTQEVLLKALVGLGFKEVDAKIYFFLAKEGPRNGRTIAEALNLYKQQLYRSLKRLKTKSMVIVSFDRPARFSATSFEKVLDLWIEAKKEQALALQENKEELLSTWSAIIKKKSPDN